MVSIQTCENESIVEVEHPTQLLIRQNHIRYLHGMNDNEQASVMQMINEMRQRRAKARLRPTTQNKANARV